MLKSLLSVTCLLVWALPTAYSQDVHPPTTIPPTTIPAITDLSTTTVSLITVGLGKALHARYGHTFLKVVAKEHPRSFIYNWGMFSFNDPLFPLKFYLGERIYWVERSDERHLIPLYKRHEDRNVWEQPINLTNAQKQRLIEGINRAIHPDEMYFRYEHFTANCATIPRDLLNQTLGGMIHDKLSSMPSELNYRYYVREHMSIIPPLGFLLDVVMNSKLDGTLSRWQESFYPAKLAEYLTALPAIDDQGQAVEGSSLLGEKTTLVAASSEHLSTMGHFPLLVFIITTILWLVCLWLQRLKKRLWQVLWRGYSSLWAGMSALLGLIMIISWIFSTHYDMHHNLNLWLFFPLDIVLVYAACKTQLSSHRLTKYIRSYLWIRISMCLIYLLIIVMGLSQQDVTKALYYLMPQQVMFLGLWLITTSQVTTSQVTTSQAKTTETQVM